MKTLCHILLLAALLLLCSFKTLDVEKIRATPEEKAADKAVLDAIKMSPEYFYNKYFMYPKFRDNHTSNRSDICLDSIINNAKHKGYPSQVIDNHMDSLFIADYGKDAFEQRQKSREHFEKFKEHVKSRLTPERMELIRQQRKLASEFCSLTPDKNLLIVLDISKEEAASHGISEIAYDYFASWVNDINKTLKEKTKDLENISGTISGYCNIYFDDDLDSKDNDVLIRTPKKK